MLKKLKLFFLWRKTIKESKFELQQKFNLRIDSAQRLYTVINVPEELIGEAYALKKQDIDRISETYIRGFSGELTQMLNERGLQELFRVYEIRKVEKYSYLLVIGFSLFESQRYYNTVYYIITPLLILTSIIFSSIFFL
jgi:hypothetical protein